jgi:SAM-dependent methyltransferase
LLTHFGEKRNLSRSALADIHRNDDNPFMDRETVKDFFDAWSLYDRVLDLNYMFHEEIYRHVTEVLARRFAAESFSILDLGCGSARHLAQALEGRAVRRYLGYDLSENALKEARHNLARLGHPMEFKAADFFAGLLEGVDERFDLIFSSFSLHHLASSDKGRFFERARQRLAEGGMLLVIDVAREEGEDLAVYLDNYCHWIRNAWTELTAEQLNFIFNHIRESDFPESDSALKSMAVEGGFQPGIDIARILWHRIWVFENADEKRAALLD